MNRTRKSSGSETTFDRDLTESAEIEAGVLRMADDVWAWCEKSQAFGRTVKEYGPSSLSITRLPRFAHIVKTSRWALSASRASS